MMMIMFMLGILISINFVKKYFLKVYLINLILIMLIYNSIYNLNIKSFFYWVKIYFDFSMDKISFILIMLIIWLMFLMILSYINEEVSYLKINMYMMIMMMLILIMFFMTINLIKFYLLYEIGLIPIFILILGWGKQPERLGAGIYMMLYTVVFSLPFFLILMFINYNYYTMSFLMLMNMNIMLNGSMILYLFMIMIFLVKLPIYMIHLWLPKAHVEAPIYGSMILAGILLKLGGYGFMRIFYMLSKMILYYNLLMMIFILWGGVIVSLMCLRQIDLKMLIAYSSIVHMSLVIVSLMTGFEIGMLGGLIMMIAHGLCSSGLFCLLNLNYKRTNSRLLFLNKGMFMFYSNLSLMWFIFCVFNMSAPPSINLASEIFMLISILKFSNLFMIYIFILSFFSGVYSIYLYSFSQHGYIFLNWSFNKFINVSEYLLIINHFFPLVLFILNLMYFF